ncbi:MAG: hypothetical protein D6830_07170, partial [Ignavibacteria bacterium]
NNIPNHQYNVPAQSGSFMNTIEERLKARAGNPVYSPQNTQVKKTNGEKIFGEGITEAEIQKIIREFNS